MIKISDVKVGLGAAKEQELEAIASFLGIDKGEIKTFKLLRRSIDARRKKDICQKCTFCVHVDAAALRGKTYPQYVEPERLKTPSAKGLEVVVVGSGPSGLFSALTLAKSGAKVTVLEKGERMDKRIASVERYLKSGRLNPLGNIQEGEGGAGTFSDGKLNSGINSPLVYEVLATFHDNGAPEDVLIDSRPHVGTDLIRKVVVSIRKDIERLGGKFLFETEFVDFKRQGEKLCIIATRRGKTLEFVCDKLVLGLGYSARNTHRMLASRGMEYQQKAFSVGYRIEHLQKDINISQYGSDDLPLPPAEYKLFEHLDNGRTVYTFCMCPGGVVVPAVSAEGEIVTNGMSYHARDGKNANSALLVSVEPSDFKSSEPLAGMDFQQGLEREAFRRGGGDFVVTRVGDFLRGRATTALGKVLPTIRPRYALGNVGELLPPELVSSLRQGLKLMKNKCAAFGDEDALLTGIETRSSAPFAVPRGPKNQTNLAGIYSVGEGAGMAGGIVSSAVDGIKIALSIIEEFKDGSHQSN